MLLEKTIDGRRLSIAQQYYLSKFNKYTMKKTFSTLNIIV